MVISWGAVEDVCGEILIRGSMWGKEKILCRTRGVRIYGFHVNVCYYLCHVEMGLRCYLM